MAKDTELKNLVASGQSHFVRGHFLIEAMNLEGIDPNMAKTPTEILRELIRRSDTNQINNRTPAELGSDRESYAALLGALDLKDDKLVKTEKCVTFAPELETVNLIDEYDHDELTN